MRHQLQTLVTQGDELFKKIQGAMPLLAVGAFLIEAQSRTRNSDDSLTRSLSEPQTLIMLGATAILFVMASLYILFLPRDASVQADASVDLNSSFKSNSSSALFMWSVKSHESLKHTHRITSEKFDDFAKQITPYVCMLISAGVVLPTIPQFIEADQSKKQLFLIPYLMHAAIIFGSVQKICHSKPSEPRRKDCETQIDETQFLQPRV